MPWDVKVVVEELAAGKAPAVKGAERQEALVVTVFAPTAVIK